MPKLLLADDSVTIQRVIELTFADEQIQVIAVGDGKAAIEHIQSDAPDVVLADVGMPERDGYEVAEFIKGSPQFAHIPVLLLTGAFEPIDDVRAKAIGCDGVLVKPFEPQMVISRVHELLRGSRKGPTAAPPDRVAGGAAAPISSGDIDRLEPAPAPERPAGDALEDYFDRLDAALANLGGAPATAAEAEMAGLSQPDTGSFIRPVPVASEPVITDHATAWNPDVEKLEPQTAAPVAAVPRPVPVAPDRQSPRPAAPTRFLEIEGELPRGPIPALHAAFAALLAAEQGEPVDAPLPEPAVTLSEEVMEEIAGRVVVRLDDDRMRALVLETAERLVREEIERIKKG